MSDALAAMRALVGRPIGAPSVAPDPVNQPMIRHWAAAMEDHNPIYVDPAFAAASRFGGIVAPPLMLQTWTMPTPKITGIAERGGAPTEGGENPLTLLDEAGFVATLATNSEFEIVRYLRLGEVITSTMVVESVSEEKRTRLTVSLNCGPDALPAAPGLNGDFVSIVEVSLVQNWCDSFTQVFQSMIGSDANTPRGTGTWYGFYTQGVVHGSAIVTIRQRL